MAARTSSVADTARADSPVIGARIDAWSERLAEVDWIPWLIIALGAFLRIFWLDIKPPHFDEGINGWFVDQMTKNGFYRYDPTNYHGPLHFYILFLSQTLFGRNLWALRLPVVLASIYSIWLTLKFEPLVGRRVARLAALAMAVSPGFVFYGRYSIHEVWMLLFSMLFILGLLGLWKIGSAKYLWCAGMGLFGMILTKETYIIHVGCAAIAMLVAWVSHKITPTTEAAPARQTWTHVDFTLAVFAGMAALIIFYSGTFLNWNGLKGLYETFDAWFKTGSQGNGHEKPWDYWLRLIGRYEIPVALGIVACVACQFFQRISVRYLAIYGVGTLAAYSIVHYKTPWCIISIVWPFLFIFGGIPSLAPLRLKTAVYAAAGIAIALLLGYAIYATKEKEFDQVLPYVLIPGAAVLLVVLRWHVATVAMLGLSLLFSLGACIRLNYFRCTTDTEPYVYVQTYNDINRLTDPLLKLVRKNPVNYQLTGHMIRTSAYPFPWILGDFPRIGYYEKDNLPNPVDGDFLLVQEDRIKTVEEKLQGSYYTMPLTIRRYQEPSKLYLSARLFRDFFPGKVPDFSGKGTPPPAR